MSNYNILHVNVNTDMNINSHDGYSFYVIDATNNDITIDLLTSCLDGLTWKFHREDNTSFIVTINPPSGKTINGNSSKTLGGSQSCRLIYTNDNFICA